MTTRQPFWKWRCWKTKCFNPQPQAHEIWNWNSKANLSYAPETMPPTEYTNEKSNMAANRLLPIYTSILLLKLGVDIQSQTEVRVRKPKNPIWPPGGHFETDVAYGHNKHAHEIWSWNSKANSENHVVYRQTDRQDESSIHTPSNFIGWGYNEKNFGQICTHERHPIACP